MNMWGLILNSDLKNRRKNCFDETSSSLELHLQYLTPVERHRIRNFGATDDGNHGHDKSIALISTTVISVALTGLTMAKVDEVVLYSVEAGSARTVHFGTCGVVAAGFSRARLWRPGRDIPTGDQELAALFLVNIAHVRSHRDGSSELTCHGR